MIRPTLYNNAIIQLKLQFIGNEPGRRWDIRPHELGLGTMSVEAHLNSVVIAHAEAGGPGSNLPHH